MLEKKELIKSLIVGFQQRIPINSVTRETVIPINTGKIISVCGVRRCGKTYRLYDTINQLVKQNVTKPENILFLNFDDERLNLGSNELDLILQSYKELFPQSVDSEIYIFFDEIQVAEGWEQFVRRIYDNTTRNIFVSGSNSKLLATDIATSLRGRTIQFEVFPLSFKEYTVFKSLETNYYVNENKARLINGFYQLMNSGGFPELVLNNYMYGENILQEYYHVMLYRDVVERYNVRNLAVLNYFVKRLLANLSKPTSINKIYNEIKSAGLKTDKNMLYEFADQLDAIYFTQRLPKLSNSVLKTELANEKKIYFIDNGLVNALNYTFHDDFGKLFENMVFLWLRRQVPFGRGLYFFKGKRECDFVVLDRDKPVKLVQACWDISDAETLKREIAGLVEASQTLNCHDATIITPEHEEEINTGNLSIKIQAAWKLMLT